MNMDCLYDSVLFRCDIFRPILKRSEVVQYQLGGIQKL